MTPGLDCIEEWIPEQMEPGTMFVLENNALGEAGNPYVAVLSCPACGTLGLITRMQFHGIHSLICGSNRCSAEYYLREEKIVYRAPN